jgi:hypothetical protein
MKSDPIATRVAEFLKAARQGPQSVPELCDALEWDRQSAARWCKELTEQGVLLDAGKAPPGSNRHQAQLYVLSPEWGGPKP